MINPSPCIYCQERYVLCHAECKKYMDWQFADKARREKIKAAKAKDSDFDRFKKTVVRATKKATERGR